ncbi:heme exporter protein CcmD [Pasteurellaceae bacterium HPA106]|uniref:heme exporter protein CcmD n=1 Tax=Spirabiliibacterium pneumoniae TaxID=221400 RepID=UPI001AAE058E|nr:heme exporter protein CcmD [Spirabiliibacterium pneumoniae]MBE2897190.1 heme exporter protein CcmD [Spirabiliibacterium pneumoniae]
MTPFFGSFADFIHMGGYGFYVWLCYGLTALCLLLLIVLTLIERKQLLRNIAKYHQRQAQQAQFKRGQHES